MTHYFVFGVLVMAIVDPLADYIFPTTGHRYIGDFIRATAILAAMICQAVEIWGK